MKNLCVGLLSSLVVAAATGCSHDQPAKAPTTEPQTATSTAPTSAPPATPLTTETPDAGATMGASAPAMADAGVAQAAAPAADPPLTDAQILDVTHTANEGEIEQAKMAEAKSHNAQVKSLAAMMIKDHTAADAKGKTVAKSAMLTPSESSTSRDLQSQASGATSNLKSETGATFDKDYVDTQVKEHQAVLDIIDQKLIPAASNADVKSYLTEVRDKVAMHLRHAQDLQKALQK